MKIVPKTAFQPGCAPGPGRPIGSRSKLSETMLRLMAADAEEHGAAVIEEVRKTKPHVWLQVMASLLPRQVSIEKLSPFSDLSDAEITMLEEMLAAGRAKLVRKVEPVSRALIPEPLISKK